MEEHGTFKHMCHTPKVWGVTYTELFICLGIGLLTTTVGFGFSSDATAGLKLGVIGFGIIVTGVAYGICFFYEAQDQIKPEIIINGLSRRISAYPIDITTYKWNIAFPMYDF